MEALLKIASGYYKHEERHKDYELCLDKFKLELFKNIDMTLMFEKDIRDEITQSVKRYAKVITNL